MAPWEPQSLERSPPQKSFAYRCDEQRIFGKSHGCKIRSDFWTDISCKICLSHSALRKNPHNGISRSRPGVLLSAKFSEITQPDAGGLTSWKKRIVFGNFRQKNLTNWTSGLLPFPFLVQPSPGYPFVVSVSRPAESVATSPRLPLPPAGLITMHCY